jgi:hypothetical protein
MARRPGTALPSMFVGNKPAVARPTLAAAVLALSDICRNWCCKKRCESAVNKGEMNSRYYHGASPREVAHAERRWRMHGGSKTHPRRGSAAPQGGEGTLLATGPREARSYPVKGQQFHVESPHLQSQQQTLSAASRVEQA